MSDTINPDHIDLAELREDYERAYQVCNEIASVIGELACRLGAVDETPEVHCLRALARGIDDQLDCPISVLQRMAQQLGIDDAERAA